MATAKTVARVMLCGSEGGVANTLRGRLRATEQSAASWSRSARPQRALLPAVMEVASSFLADAGDLPAVVTDSASPFLILAVNSQWLRATGLTRGEVS